jgi:hypothetical protein
MKSIVYFIKTSYPNEEVTCTELIFPVENASNYGFTIQYIMGLSQVRSERLIQLYIEIAIKLGR